MGQLIPFTVTPLPSLASTGLLDMAERTLFGAIRWWVAAFRRGGALMPRLRQDLTVAGAPDATLFVDGLIAIVARAVRPPIVVHCPRCPHLSEDKAHLFHAVNSAQFRKCDLAERALRTALHSAPGTEFALGLLERLGVVRRC